MTIKHVGICPFCISTVKPVVVEENLVRRDVCECPECHEKILVCRSPGCTSYAKSGAIYDDELCPECTESIANGTGEVLKWGLIAAVSAIGTAVAAKATDKS